jgi:hypothetical protein
LQISLVVLQAFHACFWLMGCSETVLLGLSIIPMLLATYFYAGLKKRSVRLGKASDAYRLAGVHAPITYAFLWDAITAFVKSNRLI